MCTFRIVHSELDKLFSFIRSRYTTNITTPPRALHTLTLIPCHWYNIYPWYKLNIASGYHSDYYSQYSVNKFIHSNSLPPPYTHTHPPHYHHTHTHTHTHIHTHTHTHTHTHIPTPTHIQTYTHTHPHLHTHTHTHTHIHTHPHTHTHIHTHTELRTLRRAVTTLTRGIRTTTAK